MGRHRGKCEETSPVRFEAIPDADATTLFKLTKIPKLLSDPELNLAAMLESDFQKEDVNDDGEEFCSRHL